MLISELTQEEIPMTVELRYQSRNDNLAGIIFHDPMNVEEEISLFLTEKVVLILDIYKEPLKEIIF